MLEKIFNKSKSDAIQVDNGLKTQSLIDEVIHLRPDIPEKNIIDMLLDGDEYLKNNPDVTSSGMCPVEHFYNYGEREKRNFSYPNFRHKKKFNNNQRYATTIYSVFPLRSGTNLYRGTFPYEGNDNVIFNHFNRSLKDTIINIFSSSEVIFIRPNHNDMSLFLMRLCSMIGVKVTFNIDDLMLPEYVEFQGAVRSNDLNSCHLIKTLSKDSSLLLLADKIICSTPKLVEIYSKSHDNVILQRNKLPLRYFNEKISQERTEVMPLKILYLSGTKTHLMDFSIISGVLMRIFQSHGNNFEITFLGDTGSNSTPFKAIGCQVKEIGVVDFDMMMDVISTHDVVLVPLENTVFNNSKSNIKFIESAARSVPVIASPISEFSEFIDHGKNGWLCKEPDEWYECITKLINNRKSLVDAGKNAFLECKLDLSHE